VPRHRLERSNRHLALHSSAAQPDIESSHHLESRRTGVRPNELQPCCYGSSNQPSGGHRSKKPTCQAQTTSGTQLISTMCLIPLAHRDLCPPAAKQH
jgi:hypothetical protein